MNIQDYQYNEIATLLSILHGTVMSRLYHARTALRHEYWNLDRATARSSPENVTCTIADHSKGCSTAN